jgi:hypothetical protein
MPPARQLPARARQVLREAVELLGRLADGR